MVDNTGHYDVQDVRKRNRGIKIAILILIVLIVLIGLGLILYFFVFADNERLELIPEAKNNLIWYKHTNDSDGEKWAQKIDKFLEVYQNPPEGDKKDCKDDYNTRTMNESLRDIPCKIDVSKLQECSSKNSRYGYTDGQGSPCVIIKVKKVYDWVPESYTDVQEAEESSMPQGVIDYIRLLKNSPLTHVQEKLNSTWVTCEGEEPSDKELIGPIGYYFPGHNDDRTYAFGRIPNEFFPYLEQSAYLEPFIFVKFHHPEPNVVIKVKCQLWAKNFDVDEGSVHLQIMVD